MVGTSSSHTMYLNVAPGLMTGFSALTAGFASINQQIQNVTHTTQENFGLFDTLISTATVLLAQFTKGAIDAYAQYEQGMKIVQAVSNQTATAMDDLKQKSTEFSIQYRTDIDQITEGLQTLGRAGLNNAAEQAEVLQNGLQTAKLEGRELNSVLQELIQNIALLGGDLKSDQFGEQSQYVNDLLVATSMTAPITTHDISETLKYSGGIAAAAGANIESDEGKEILTDYMASIAAFAQKGVTGSIAGTALRAFFNKPATQDSSVVEGLSMVGLSPEDLWQDGGERMKPVSQQIGLIKKQMDELNISTMDQLQIWSKIVGGKMGQQMMKLDSSDIKELTKDIKAADNASSLANQSMQTYQMNVKQVEEAGQAIYRNIGEYFVVILNPIVAVISKIMELLTNPYASFAIWFGIMRTLLYGAQKIWGVIKLVKAELGSFIDVLTGKAAMLENEQLVALQNQEKMLRRQYGDRIAIMETQQSIDSLQAKAMMAENEQIQKLQHEVNELKAQESIEAKLIALKKEKAALEEQSAMAAAGGAGALSAKERKALSGMYSVGQINQLEKMLTAKAATASPMAGFKLNSALYKDLQAAMGDKEAKRLVTALKEGRLEITEDITTIDELMATLNEEEAETKKASASTKENAASKNKEAASSAKTAEVGAILTEVLDGLSAALSNLTLSAEESQASSNSAAGAEERLNVEQSEAGAIVGHTATQMQNFNFEMLELQLQLESFLRGGINNRLSYLVGPGIVNPVSPTLTQWNTSGAIGFSSAANTNMAAMMVGAGATSNLNMLARTTGGQLALDAERAAIMGIDEELVQITNTFPTSVQTVIQQINRLITRLRTAATEIAEAQIVPVKTSNPYTAGAASNAYIAASNYKAPPTAPVGRITPGSVVASNVYQKNAPLTQQQKEIAKQNAIIKGNTAAEQRRRRILGDIAVLETEILQSKRTELEEEMRISEGEIQYFNSLESMSIISEEQQVEMTKVLTAYQLQQQLLNKINAELQSRIAGETEEVVATEQDVVAKEQGVAIQEEINAKNKIQSVLETLENSALSTLIGGKFGGAMLVFMIAMEAWMHFFQEEQKRMQEVTDRLEEATSNYSTAIDDFNSALKEAYPEATSAEREQMELDAFSNMYGNFSKYAQNSSKWIEDSSEILAKMPKYEYNQEKDDGSTKLVEEQLTSEEQTQQELDKNTRALYRATAELNEAVDAYVREASHNWYGMTGGDAFWNDKQNPQAYRDQNDWAASPGTIRMLESQQNEKYMGSKEFTGLLLADFYKANGDWINGLTIAMGQSVDSFSEIIPEGSKKLLENIARLSATVGQENNLRLQMSMKNDKKTWQSLAKEVAKYEAKNQKSVLKAEKTGNKRLEGLIAKLQATTGGGFTRSQILQMQYLQQMSDMLSVSKEQILPVISQHMQTAAQNLLVNTNMNQNVQGTGSSTAGTYANAAIIAAYVAQMAAAKAYEAAYTQGLQMDPNDSSLSKEQKAIATAAHKANSYEEFMKNVTTSASRANESTINGAFWRALGESDEAMRGVARIYATGTYSSLYGLSPQDAAAKADKFMKESAGVSPFNMMNTLMKNYQTKGFIDTIQNAYLASGIGEVDEDDNGTGAGSGSGSGSGSDKDSDKGSTKNRVDLVLCNKKEIPKLNVNLFKKEPSFTVLNKNFKVRDIKVNTQDKPKAILSSVKNAIIDVEKRTDPKIIQDEAGEYDPVAATEGNSTPTGKTSTTIDS